MTDQELRRLACAAWLCQGAEISVGKQHADQPLGNVQVGRQAESWKSSQSGLQSCGSQLPLGHGDATGGLAVSRFGSPGTST
jgi:hypothetical protein